MSNPSLNELNAHLFANLMPDTHGGEALAAATKPAKGKKGAKAAEQTEYTAEQLEILKNAGIEDVAAADPATVAIILGR